MQRQEKKRNNKSDSDTDSCNDKNLRNLVVFTTLDSSYEKKTAAGSASASVPGSSCGGDDIADVMMLLEVMMMLEVPMM